MPRQIKVIDIFAASPSDVSEERVELEAAIDRLNARSSREMALRFELLKWESLLPGVGDDAQDVINQQIGDEYDVFLGIMWNRFGTPTRQAESGTEEEFNKALDRHREDGSQLDIMLYFKIGPVSPSEIDTQQLSKVREFKKRVAAEGVLYQEFESVVAFRDLLEIHLTKLAHRWSKKPQKTPRANIGKKQGSRQTQPGSATEDTDSDLGLFDYQHKFEKAAKNLSSFAVGIAERMEKLSSTARIETEKIVKGTKSGRLNNAMALIISKNVSVALNNFSDFIDENKETAEFDFKSLATSIKGIVEVGADFDTTPDELDETISSLEELISSMTESAVAFDELATTVGSLPRMSQLLNRARSRFASEQLWYSGSLNSSAGLLREAVQALEDMKGRN